MLGKQQSSQSETLPWLFMVGRLFNQMTNNQEKMVIVLSVTTIKNKAT